MSFLDKVKGALGSGNKEKIRNFEYLDKLISKGKNEIVLDADIILDEDEESRYSGGIVLGRKDILIDANNHFIDAKGKNRIFTCTRCNIKIKNATLKNGKSSEGGAIKLTESKIILDNVFLLNNESQKGGAIYFTGGELSISNSKFDHNHAGSDGGAIYHMQKSSQALSNNILEVSDTEFIGNSSRNDGGAIINTTIDHGGSLVTSYAVKLTACSFKENRAQKGGAIYNEPSKFENCFVINRTSFIDNQSESGGDSIYNRGSIYVPEPLEISDCQFANHTAENNIIHSHDNLKITSSIFKDNVSNAVIKNDLHYSRRSTQILDCQFINNNSLISALWNMKGDLKAVLSSFENNISKKESSCDIYNEGELLLKKISLTGDNIKTVLNEKILTVIDSNPKNINNIENLCEMDFIKENSYRLKDLDNLIHNSSSKTIKLEQNIVLDEFDVGDYKSGVDLDVDGLTIDGNGMSIDGSLIEKSVYFRLFRIAAKGITVKNLNIKNMVEYHSRGSIYIENIGECVFENCCFSNNSDVISNEGKLDLIDCRWKYNYNMLWNLNPGISIIESNNFNNNLERYKGIFNNGKLEIKSSKFTNQDCDITNQGKLTISDTLFEDNHRVPLYNEQNCVIFDSAFTNNTGRAIENLNKCELHDCRFENNSFKEEGGAIFNIGNFKAIDCKFKNNLSDGEGGAVYNSRNLNLLNCKFENNVSKKIGGAIYNKSEDEIVIEKCDFAKHTSGILIFNDGINLKCVNSSFHDNQSDFIIINNNEESTLNISDTKFENNENTYSSICNAGKIAYIINPVFENNRSENDYQVDIYNKTAMELIKPTFKNDEKTVLNEGSLTIKKLSRKDVEKHIEDWGEIELFEIPKNM